MPLAILWRAWNNLFPSFHANQLIVYIILCCHQRREHGTVWVQFVHFFLIQGWQSSGTVVLVFVASQDTLTDTRKTLLMLKCPVTNDGMDQIQSWRIDLFLECLTTIACGDKSTSSFFFSLQVKQTHMLHVIKDSAATRLWCLASLLQFISTGTHENTRVSRTPPYELDSAFHSLSFLNRQWGYRKICYLSGKEITVIQVSSFKFSNLRTCTRTTHMQRDTTQGNAGIDLSENLVFLECLRVQTNLSATAGLVSVAGLTNSVE